MSTETEVARLSELLRSGDVASRQVALTELADLLDDSALEPLLVAARDAAPTVGELAIGLLDELGHPRGIGAIVTALGDASERVRQVAAAAVRDNRLPEAVDLLLAN